MLDLNKTFGVSACEENEFGCPLQCIPAESKCDRILDCNFGLDEAHCGMTSVHFVYKSTYVMPLSFFDDY